MSWFLHFLKLKGNECTFREVTVKSIMPSTMPPFPHTLTTLFCKGEDYFKGSKFFVERPIFRMGLECRKDNRKSEKLSDL